MNYILVGIGAAFGGGMRYWLSNFVYKFLPATFPYGTLAVNVIGSFILGILMFYFDAREMLSQQMKLVLAVGFCGGFTTFSTFSVETLNLFKDSEVFLGTMNIFMNLLLCLIGVYLAYLVSKLI